MTQSIRIKDLFLRARLAAHDSGKTKYDDYEICEALNMSIDSLVSALIRYASPELMRTVELEFDENGEALLPHDFRALVSLAPKDDMRSFDSHSNFFDGEPSLYSFRIEGEKIFIPKTDKKEMYLLRYHRRPLPITMAFVADDSNTDLNISYMNTLAAMAANLLAGEIDAAEEKAQSVVSANRYDKRGAFYNPPMWSGRVSNR